MTNLEIITASLATTYSNLETQISHLSDKGELDLDTQSTVIVAGLLLIFSTIAVVRWLHIKDLNPNKDSTSKIESSEIVANDPKPHIFTDPKMRKTLPVNDGLPVYGSHDENFMTRPKPGSTNRIRKS